MDLADTKLEVHIPRINIRGRVTWTWNEWHQLHQYDDKFNQQNKKINLESNTYVICLCFSTSTHLFGGITGAFEQFRVMK